MLKCDFCAKTFTGPASYDQHLASDKHKRKVLSSGLMSNRNSAPETSTLLSSGLKSNQNVAPEALTNNVTDLICDKTLKCDFCNISFNSVEGFQQHSMTSEHALKIMMSNANSSVNCNVVSSSSNMLYNECNDNRDETKFLDDMLLPGFNDHKNLQSYDSCTICNKTFSGPEPYKQHIESALHKKKVELENDFPNIGIKPNFIAFSCEPCKKEFSGPLPYAQHMSSEIHKKKLQQIIDIQKFLPEAPLTMESNISTKEVNNTNPWFCKICSMQCSGLTPYQQHLSGATHFKNMKRAQPYSDILKGTENEKPFMQETNEEIKLPDKCENVSQLVNGSNQKDDLKMDDLILPEIVKNLKVISTEELEESIDIFLPEEKVNFDLSKDKMLIDLTNEDVNHDGLSQNKGRENHENFQGVPGKIDIDEAKEREERKVYQICSLCNVNLFNKEEAACHYESLEHFNKRWRAN